MVDKEKNIFIKKEYEEEDVVIYLHFKGEYAVRQMEISSDGITRLSEAHPISGEHFLYDQKFSDINWASQDFISQEEFENKWEGK